MSPHLAQITYLPYTMDLVTEKRISITPTYINFKATNKVKDSFKIPILQQI